MTSLMSFMTSSDVKYKTLALSRKIEKLKLSKFVKIFKQLRT